MGRTNIRILPPLVYGKLAGILEFSVDYIELTEKILENDCNFVVQLLWWGETKPLFLRPKRIEFVTKDNKKIVVDDQVGCSARYEVRTKIKLFRSYLAKCDIMELVVLDSIKNEVIGSAFLKDLICIVHKTQYFSNFIINDSGNQIGKISCHTSFFEEDLAVSNTNEASLSSKNRVDVFSGGKWNSNDLNLNLNLTALNSPTEETLMRLDALWRENNLHDETSANQFKTAWELETRQSSNVPNNSPVTNHSTFNVDISEVLQPIVENAPKFKYPALGDSNMLTQKESGENVNSERSEKCSISDEDRAMNPSSMPPNSPRFSCIDLKERKNLITANDSKVLSVVKKKQEGNLTKKNDIRTKGSTKVAARRTSTSRAKAIVGSKVPKNKPGPTKNSNVIEDKTKSTNPKNLGRMSNKTCNIKKSVSKPTSNMKTFVKVSNEVSKLNKLYLGLPRNPRDNHLDLEEVPVKESRKDPKQTESTEKDSQDQNPSDVTHENAEGSKQGLTENNSVETALPTNQNLSAHKERVIVNSKLSFDLDNPIERLYYETFFSKSEPVCGNEFEIAEMLNQPENKHILETAPQGRPLCEENQTKSDELINGELQTSANYRNYPSMPEQCKRNDKNKADGLIVEDAFKSCQASGSSEESNFQRDFQSDCYRCKYYKKLSELDKIIESLRHFESRLKSETKESNQCLDEQPTNVNDHLGQPNPAMEIFMQNSSHGDIVSDNVSTVSDLSKDNSDFLEFLYYLSRRSLTRMPSI